MRQFQPLTSLRAFLAFWVLFRHWFYAYDSVALIDIGNSSVFKHGYLGVDGFFVLSGFILTYTYASAHSRPYDPRQFIVARIARVFPAYLACLFGILALVLLREYLLHKPTLGTDPYTAAGFILSLFMLSSWRYAGPGAWNDVAWSVSAEWFAYVFFPVFLLLAPPSGKTRIFCVSGLALAMLAAVEATSPDHLSLSGGIARLVPEFLLGVLLCRLREALPSYKGCASGTLVSIIICTSGLVLNLDTLWVLGIAGVILSLTYARDALTGILSSSVLVFLGELSYCIYIVQRIPQYIFSLLRNRFEPVAAISAPLQVLVLLVMTLLAALLVHYLVEKPMRVYINRRFATRSKNIKSLKMP